MFTEFTVATFAILCDMCMKKPAMISGQKSREKSREKSRQKRWKKSREKPRKKLRKNREKGRENKSRMGNQT